MSSLKYLAILGRQPELGLAELESLLGGASLTPFGPAVLLDKPVELDRLGGVIKLAEIVYDGPEVNLMELPVNPDGLPLRPTKTPFALSIYGEVSSRAVAAAGLDLKRRLKSRGSVRLVMPGKGTAVSAAELTHNRVLEDGFELVVVTHGTRSVVARTLGVQDIEGYARRDYGRPARSAKVGMLPPKLAQVLVNTTSASLVVDPFCGSGVVLQEALLVGRSVRGTDLSAEMVTAAKENLTWLAANYPLSEPDWQVELGDARQVQLPDSAAVVTEGYLGPPLSSAPTAPELSRIRHDLMPLYRDTLANWAGSLQSGAELALCVPAWRVDRRWHYLGLVDELANLGYTLKRFEHVRNPLLYARTDQVVGRQIFLLRKI